MVPVEIRSAHLTDLPAIVEIYNHYVLSSASTFDLTPRTISDRQEWFDEHASRGRHRLLVARTARRVVGYASTSRLRPRPAYDSTVESSVYVAADAVGHGIGTRLCSALFEAIAPEEVHRIVVGLTEWNPASLSLHRRFGFQQIGRFHEVGWKFGRYWDVLWFERPGRPAVHLDQRRGSDRGV